MGEDNHGEYWEHVNQSTGDYQIWMTNVKLLYAFLGLGLGRSATEFPWTQLDLCERVADNNQEESQGGDGGHKVEWVVTDVML